MSSLATRFSRNRTSLRASRPLTDDEIKGAAPSIFAEDKHESRSERYAHIPTSVVIAGLRKEGFEPFEVTQSRCRVEGKTPFTKHMLRLRHSSQIGGDVANEIILINSHDGTSSYQMLAGVFRFVCANGLICGDEVADIRIPHKGDVQGRVIEGAYSVLDEFAKVDENIKMLKGTHLDDGHRIAFARAALALRYDEEAAPITESALLQPRRFVDNGNDFWRTFNVVQENMMRGGLPGRNAQGKRTTTRPVQAIDTTVKLNRALSVLAEEMLKLKAAA